MFYNLFLRENIYLLNMILWECFLILFNFYGNGKFAFPNALRNKHADWFTVLIHNGFCWTWMDEDENDGWNNEDDLKMIWLILLSFTSYK